MRDAQEKRKLAANWREYFHDSKEGFRVYAWVWRELIGPESKAWIRKSLVWLLFATALGMAEPLLVSNVFNGLILRDSRMIVIGLAGFIIAASVGRVFNWQYQRCRECSQGATLGRIDQRTSELFFEKSLGQHMRDTSALNASNVEKGRNRVIEVDNLLFGEGVTATLELAVGMAFLWLISPVAGALTLLLFANYVFWMFFLNRRILVACTPLDIEFRRLNRHRVERWDNVERVKSCGKEGEEVRVMTSWFDRVVGDDRRFWLWYLSMSTIRGLIGIAVVAAIFCYGAWKVWDGAWLVGTLYPLYRLIRQVGDNMWRFGQIEHRLNWNMPSIRSMMEALAITPDVLDKPGAADIRPDGPVRIELDAVAHTYASRVESQDDEAPLVDGPVQPHVLSHVSFAIEPGEKVALIGPSGAGKTTVMRLLQRYMDPEQGSILVNGKDLRDIRLASWTSVVGYIPQQAQVLDGSIRYNLLYGLPEEERPKIKDEQLWDLMRKLQIDFGERLTQGLDTIVGRRGIKLSGGQAQRLMIGSAVMRRPRLMIIDEATSSLASTTEKAVQKGLADTLAPETSALIITHRLSTVRHLCSKFIVLRQAEDLEAGASQVEAIASSFEDLAMASPTFSRLAKDQGIILSVK
jgi:ATP-binding cassette subfamily C protein